MTLHAAHVVSKLPAQDLDRARRFYAEKLGLEPIEERSGGLRYVCGETEFHLFATSGAPSGTATQMGFEVADLEATLEELKARGVKIETYAIPGFENRGDMILAPDN